MDTHTPPAPGEQFDELAIRQFFDQFPKHPKTLARAIEEQWTLEAAKDHMLEALAQAGNPEPGPAGDVQQGEDARDKLARGIEAVLWTKAGLDVHGNPIAEKDELEAAQKGNELAGMTMLELAARSLQVGGISTRGMTPDQILARAIDPGTPKYQTSDFAAIMENIPQKALFRGWMRARAVWRELCSTSTVANFQTYTRPNLSKTSRLQLYQPPESVNNTIAELTRTDKKEEGQIKTYAGQLSYTREAIINDSLRALSEDAAEAGDNAASEVDHQYLDELVANTGRGPTLLEGAGPLYSAGNANLTTTGAPPDKDAIVAMRVAMGKQVDPNNVDLEIALSFILAGPELEDTLIELAGAEFIPDGAGATRVNTIRNTFIPVISERLGKRLRTLQGGNSEAWYGMGPRGTCADVAFLAGQAAPGFERDVGWSTFSQHWRVWIDFNVLWPDFRGTHMNDGGTLPS